MSGDTIAIAEETLRSKRKEKSGTEDKESRKRKRAGEGHRSRHGEESSLKKQRKETNHTIGDDTVSQSTLGPSHPGHGNWQDTTLTSTASLSERKRHAAAHRSHTPFAIQTISLYLPLSPVSQPRPLPGLCAEHLSPNILSYYPPLGGVLLSYSNARLSNAPEGHNQDEGQTVCAKSVDEYAASYAWLTADFISLKLDRWTWMEGSVTLQNESHLGLLCYNQFNASIERKRLPRTWRWSGAAGASESNSHDDPGGAFVDGDDNPVDGLLRFRVIDCDGMGNTGANRADGYLLIEGSLLDDGEEKAMAKAESAKRLENAQNQRETDRGYVLG